ncbi:MAG: HEAT repeat domain-containing protein [Gammaproteobacteria bacterium]
MSEAIQAALEWKYRRQFDYSDGVNSTQRRLAPRSDAPPVLLGDTDLRFFLANGFVQITPDLDAGFHARMFERCSELVGEDNDHNPGNNLLPLVPELNLVFEDPVVRGALGSVLGPDYLMHPHRVLHDNPPGSDEQVWHHDSYWGYKRKVHDHRPWWVMIMYYPQDIYREIGPTGVVPGSYCIAQRLDDIDQIGSMAHGPAGTCMMIHYDIWHRKMKNLTALKRFMIKFEFTRMSRPGQPSWDVAEPHWSAPANPPAYDLSPLWRSQYYFLAGRDHAPAPAETTDSARISTLVQQLDAPRREQRLAAANELADIRFDNPQSIAALAAHLDDDCEPVGLGSAYALASQGEPGAKALTQAMLDGDGENVDDPRVFIDEGQDSEAEMQARNAAHGLVAYGSGAAGLLVDAYDRGQPRVRKYAVYALGQIGQDSDQVLDTLVRASADEDAYVRINAVEALGLQRATEPVVRALIGALADPDDEVRFNAALSLARLGPGAGAAAGALADALYDGNRYVSGYACEALQRIGTPEALRALLPFLQSARWCPITNTKNLF